MPIYLANSRYNASLTSGYESSPADSVLNVGSVPSNVPTIVIVARGTVKETWFTVTGSSGGNQLTGVTRLRGANVDIDSGASVECINSPEFVNQYATAVFNQANLKSLVYAADGGSDDTYVITLSVVPSALSDIVGLPINFMANTVNTGAATLNVNSLGAKTIKKLHDQDLSNGDIEAGQIVTVIYDGTNFQLQSATPVTTADVTDVLVTAAPAADVTASGLKISLVAAENLVFGDVVYVNSSGKMAKADADAIATSSALFMALATISTDATGLFLAVGIARNDAWSWTVGGLIYLSTTAGGLTQTAPSGTDDVIQILGVATHADRMFFNPSIVQVEHT